jgi:hypothetical protein
MKKTVVERGGDQIIGRVLFRFNLIKSEEKTDLKATNAFNEIEQVFSPSSRCLVTDIQHSWRFWLIPVLKYAYSCKEVVSIANVSNLQLHIAKRGSVREVK